jgi:hypothetical protein
MASGIGDFARKVANRAETVVGDDVRAAKGEVKASLNADRDIDHYWIRKVKGRPKARKPASSRSGR